MKEYCIFNCAFCWLVSFNSILKLHGVERIKHSAPFFGMTLLFYLNDASSYAKVTTSLTRRLWVISFDVEENCLVTVCRISLAFARRKWRKEQKTQNSKNFQESNLELNQYDKIVMVNVFLCITLPASQLICPLEVTEEGTITKEILQDVILQWRLPLTIKWMPLQLLAEVVPFGIAWPLQQFT